MEPFDKKYEKKRVSTLCLGPAALLAASFLGMVIFSGVAMLAVPAAGTSRAQAFWLSAAAQYLIGMPLCMITLSLVRPDKMEKYTIPFSQFLRLLVILFFFMVAGELIGAALSIVPGFPQGTEVEEVLRDVSPLYLLLIVVFIGPLTEELVFRKMMIDRLNRLGDVPAIFISSLLFALSHANPAQFFYVLPSGLVLGYVYVRTGRVFYTVVMHMLANLLLGVVPALLMNTGITALAVAFGVLQLIVAAAGLVVFVLNIRKIRLLKGWVSAPRLTSVTSLVNTGMLVFVLLTTAAYLLSKI